MDHISLAEQLKNVGQKNNQYRLKPDEVNLVMEYRQNKDLREECEKHGIPFHSVKHYWHKSKKFSIMAKGGDPDPELLKNELVELIENYSPKYPDIQYPKYNDPCLLIVNPADVHIGKYGSPAEHDDPYNVDIARKRVIEGIQGILNYSQGYNIQRILFAVGNDILHTDGHNKTTSGTPQSVHMEWHEHFVIALELYVEAVEMLMQIAPVDCIHSMSNHDYYSGFHLAHCLKSWYRNSKNVSVDASPSHRKYYKYGNSLLGFSHGDGAKMNDLPLIMANESKQWDATIHRYWFLHHVHHKIKQRWLDGKDYHGCSVEYMRSPSGTDSWHHRNGYQGSAKAIEGFIISKNNGQIARLNYIFAPESI